MRLFDPTGIVVIALVFVLGAPLAAGLAAVLILGALSLSFDKSPVLIAIIPTFWAASVGKAYALHFTILAPLIGAGLMRISLYATFRHHRSLVRTRARMVVVFAICGGMAMVLPYLAIILFDSTRWAQFGTEILLLALAAGALLGAFIACFAIGNLERYISGTAKTLSNSNSSGREEA